MGSKENLGLSVFWCTDQDGKLTELLLAHSNTKHRSVKGYLYIAYTVHGLAQRQDESQKVGTGASSG